MHFRSLFITFCRMMVNVSFKTIFAMALIHYWCAYVLFSWSGEPNLVSSHIHFSYYWVVTATTLGYGDATPITPGGKLTATLFMIPASIALFGLFLAKTGNAISTYFRKELTGMRNYDSLNNHTLIIGYHPVRTGEMLKLLQAEQSDHGLIVLVSDVVDNHPFQELKNVSFCRVESMKDRDSVKRMGVVSAGKIIVDGRDDNENFVLASHYAGLNSSAKVVTYITDTHSAERLQLQFPNINVIIDNREELVVRALMDSGSGTLVNKLLRADVGPTFFMTPLLAGVNGNTSIASISAALTALNATFIGYAKDLQGNAMVLNPTLSELIPAGSVFIHYIASDRISPDVLMSKLAEVQKL